MAKNKKVTGGEFIVKETEAKDIFIPEEFDEEQKMIAQTCRDFLKTEIFPNLDRIDQQEEGLMADLLSKAGEYGLLGISIPEKYEGFEQSVVTSMLAADVMGAGYSFAVAYSCHTGIGSLPILYYGNEQQKEKYLPKLASGEWKGAYALTEPGAGSDANAGKTNATLSEDGKYYLLNGQKMWITNAGFSDLFVVYAKIDNDRVLSAFIVERDFPGIVFNPEEKKMGIKGSSTRQIFFNDCKVPVENLLGKRGEGFRIALNILHMGRIKLGGNVLGAAKLAIDQSVQYSNERKQFKQLIGSFGSIKHKLAEQVIKHFSTESAVYRASYNIDQYVEKNLEVDMLKEKVTIDAFAQFAVEAAILKVYGSEALDYIVDENVQIHGGMGFSAEMNADRGYRDSRINRIFEGTNEINKMLVVDTILKRGAKGYFNLFDEAEKEYKKLVDLSGNPQPESEFFAEKKQMVRNFRKSALFLFHVVSEKFQRKLMHEQEILNNIADIIMLLYVSESSLLRVEKLKDIKDPEQLKVYKDIIDVYFYDTSSKIIKFAKDAIYSFAEGEVKELLIKGLNYYISDIPVNTKEARRRIADKLIEDNKYDF